MGELPAVTCASCGEPMVRRREHAGRGRLRLDLPEPRPPGAGRRGAGGRGPGRSRGVNERGNRLGCRRRGARRPSRAAGRARRGRGEEARAREADAPARARERAQAELARLRAQLLELGRLAEGAGALAAHLDDALVISYHSDSFAEAQEARQAPAAVGVLCAVLRRTAGDAQDRLAGIEPELPGLFIADEV